MEDRATYNTRVEKLRRETLAGFAAWQPPTSDEVRAALSMAGWGEKELAGKLGCDPQVVSGWLEGGDEIPYPVWCVLALQAGFGRIWVC